MPPLYQVLRRGLSLLVAGVLLATLSISPAFAAPYDYTDNWYVPAEEGWGANFTQSDNFLFVTFFIYGIDKQPTWYTAQTTWDGNNQFAGNLYRTTGSYFASQWDPADKLGGPQQVGSATFTPSTLNNYEGTLSYTVSGVGTVTKAVTRLTLTPILLSANYVGGQSGSYTGCTAAASNKTYQDFFNLSVSQSGMNVTLSFTYQGATPPLTCSLAGTMVQNGSIYRIANATYQCSDGLNTNASVSDLRATPLGIEGRFDAPTVGGGCRETANFGGTLH